MERVRELRHPGGSLDRDAPAAEPDDAGVLPGAELLVDALARRSHEIGEILLGQADLDGPAGDGPFPVLCGERDEAFCDAVTRLCREIIAAQPVGGHVADAEAVSLGLTGLIDQLWQTILFEGDAYDRETGWRQCRAYLRSVFPHLADRIDPPAAPAAVVRSVVPASDEAGPKYTLPAWVYQDAEFHELEKEHLLLPNWQIV